MGLWGRQPHTVHDFRRHISQADDGRVLFGCTHGSELAGCSATEIRHPHQPSPFAVARAKRRNAARVKRWEAKGAR